MLYAKFYASQNICFVLIHTYLYVHIYHIHTNTYLRLTDSLFPLHQSQIASGEKTEDKGG